jgi:hypothetical protein
MVWQVRVASASEQMARLFRHAHIFQLYQPTYASGHYAFMLASDQIHPYTTKPDWEAWAKKAISTRYYNPDVHYASFLLASQLQTVLHGVPRLHQLAPEVRRALASTCARPLRHAQLRAEIRERASSACDARCVCCWVWQVFPHYDVPGVVQWPVKGDGRGGG